jgi:hypothetical protein
MATFQYIVMITSTVILIISLCFIGIALYKQKYSGDYPPIIANCPDYWIDSSGNGARCVVDPNNPNGNQTANCTGSMDFTQAQWSGQGTGACSKYKWAKTCNLSWDGITNNADICGASG